jgi:hypothetical protein
MFNNDILVAATAALSFPGLLPALCAPESGAL